MFPEHLSEWNLYQGDMHELQPAAGVIPYTLSSALFSDYAEKSRFVRLPSGTQMTTDARGKVLFPEGSVIIKNFYYYDDVRQPEQGHHVVETRLLVKEKSEWEVATYIWNDAQTEASLEILGAEREVKWIDATGTTQHIHYLVPDNNDCKGCHLQRGEVKPIGPRLVNMACDSPLQPGADQIAVLTERGILSTIDAVEKPTNMVAWEDESAPIHDRALAYLDINCAHCHSEIGPASNTGLFLHHDQTDPFRLGVMKTPVSAAQGSAGFNYNVVPGDPGKSILLYRMNSVESGIAMPETGRTMIHQEGVALIRQWINSIQI